MRLVVAVVVAILLSGPAWAQGEPYSDKCKGEPYTKGEPYSDTCPSIKPTRLDSSRSLPDTGGVTNGQLIVAGFLIISGGVIMFVSSRRTG